jgi:hypothetical protein
MPPPRTRTSAIGHEREKPAHVASWAGSSSRQHIGFRRISGWKPELFWYTRPLHGGVVVEVTFDDTGSYPVACPSKSSVASTDFRRSLPSRPSASRRPPTQPPQARDSHAHLRYRCISADPRSRRVQTQRRTRERVDRMAACLVSTPEEACGWSGPSNMELPMNCVRSRPPRSRSREEAPAAGQSSRGRSARRRPPDHRRRQRRRAAPCRLSARAPRLNAACSS